MKAKIDAAGKFYLERNGMLVKQTCPHSGIGYCGEGCPLFGITGKFNNDTQTLIKLCQREWLVELVTE